MFETVLSPGLLVSGAGGVGQVEHNGGVGGLEADGAGGRVDERCVAVRHDPITWDRRTVTFLSIITCLFHSSNSFHSVFSNLKAF